MSSPADVKEPPELTVSSVIGGLFMAAIMFVANLFLVLKAGITVGASIPCSVIGRAFFRKKGDESPILKVNIFQTTGSGGETIAAGVGFAVVALYMGGVWQGFDFFATTCIILTGGLLGVLLMVPLRRILIVQSAGELKYPEGTACAQILQAADREGVRRDLTIAGLIGAAFALLYKGGAMSEDLSGVWLIAGAFGIPAAFSCSPMLMSVGYVVGRNIALLLFLGSAIVWLGFIPALGHFDPNLVDKKGEIVPLFTQAFGVWASKARYVGVGAMLVGGVLTMVLKIGPKLIDAVKLMRSQRSGEVEQSRTERDMTGPLLWGLLAFTFVLFTGVSIWATDSWVRGPLLTLAMTPIALAIVAVASYTCGLVGSTNSPVSGMTLMTVFAAALFVGLLGFSGNHGVQVALIVTSVICISACCAGNTSQDLKTGHLVSATPRRQQVMLLGSVLVAALLAVPTLNVLKGAFGFGNESLPAGKAALIADVTKGLFGAGDMPWGLVYTGIGMAIGFAILDKVLAKAGIAFRFHIMPIAVGMYMPIAIPVTILLGGLVRKWVTGQTGDEDDPKAMASRGVLFAAGLIAGEALAAVLVAIPIFLGSELKFSLGISPGLLAVLLFGALVVYFQRIARNDSSASSS